MVRRTVLLLSALFAALVPSAHADRLYWTEGGTRIMRGDLDGRRAEVAVETLDSEGIPFVTVDPLGGKIYWSTWGDYGLLRWGNLDGSAVEDLAVNVAAPGGIALDHATGRLYFAKRSDCVPCGGIRRTDLDGANGVNLNLLDSPRGFAVDFSTGRMYWTDVFGRWIRSADLAGADERTVVGGIFPVDLALDAVAGKIYWIDLNDEMIRRADVDGSDVEDVVATGGPAWGIAVDPAGGKVYWTEWNAGKIRRANLDGSAAEDVLTGLDVPFGIAIERAADSIRLTLDAGSLEWSEPAEGLVYDVVRGSLRRLRRSLGDYLLATEDCEAANRSPPIVIEEDPVPGEAVWFLVRAVTATGDGTYESLGLGQVAPRDAGIASSGYDCPRAP